MTREELRPVEYTVKEKVKAKKGKKKATVKTKRKSGYFHIWATAPGKKGKEEIFGLVEKPKSGKLIEVSYKDIRFLNEEETVTGIIDVAFEQEAETGSPVAETAAPQAETEIQAADEKAETAPEATEAEVTAEDKPKTARKPRAVKTEN